MSSREAELISGSSPAALSAVVKSLQRRVEELEQHNQDLQIMLETATEHGDQLSENLEEERDDLETMLELASDHADVVEDELHQQAAVALQKSEQQLRLIVEATPTPVVIFRMSDDEIVYVNAMMGELFSVAVADLLGCKAAGLFFEPGDFNNFMLMLAEKGLVDKQEVRLQRPGGAPVWVQISLRQLEFNAQASVLCGVHDISHLKAMNQASSRFVPQAYLGFLKKDNITDIALGDHVAGEMTVMFSDLRGFTSISETMTPQQNFAFINAYLGRVSPVVRAHNGIIIKYLGDGIHAIFPQSADDAVRAGIDKLEQVNLYNEYRATKNRAPITIGLGLNTGFMMVGIVGEQDRMQGDTFSDEVNLTARIEGLTKFYGINFIVSHSTCQRLIKPADYNIRFLDKVQVMGRTNVVELYEVYDADAPQMRALKQETQADFEVAIALYYNRDFTGAQAKLFDVLQRNPRDKAAWHHLVNATRLADRGAPEGWTGVTVMDHK
ncbi:MAG: PAS domain-containing protein [Pseudomonadales bacterium]|nr:PAS domain-containing protein [Pseudomonadales bacterium]